MNEIKGPRVVYVVEDEFPGKYDVLGMSHSMTREEMDRGVAEILLAYEADRPAREARRRAEEALDAHLAAAPKLWCVAHGTHEQWVLAIYPTEESARAQLHLYAHLDGVEVTPFPYFPA